MMSLMLAGGRAEVGSALVLRIIRALRISIATSVDGLGATIRQDE